MVMQENGKTNGKTNIILDRFEQINRIPRASKHEDAIANHLIAWATEHGFQSKRDEVSNVVIVVPGSPGFEEAPTVVIQGHMDMVCEKAKGSNHNFASDPIQCIREGEWMHANQTTLGADNGIAIAMAQVVATDADVVHPPLELLFTVDEETGLTGANALKPGFLEGKTLLNVDSEDEGVFTVGCAGGRDTRVVLELDREPVDSSFRGMHLVVEGFRGGHSGVDIHEARGNAVQVLARALGLILSASDSRISHMHGGTAHNAIPRDAEAKLWVPEHELEEVSRIVSGLKDALHREYASLDPKGSVRIALDASADAERVWSRACSERVVDVAHALPTGVAEYSSEIEGLVQTSNNLATIRQEGETLEFLLSQRSSNMDRLDFLTRRIESVGHLCINAKAISGNGYPAWQPNMDSKLLQRCKTLYGNLFKKEPVVEVIHAGLECGIIGAKYDGMDMISFGPTIQNPHCPEERINVPSVGLVWEFLVALLRDLAERD